MQLQRYRHGDRPNPLASLYILLPLAFPCRLWVGVVRGSSYEVFVRLSRTHLHLRTLFSCVRHAYAVA